MGRKRKEVKPCEWCGQKLESNGSIKIRGLNVCLDCWLDNGEDILDEYPTPVESDSDYGEYLVASRLYNGLQQSLNSPFYLILVYYANWCQENYRSNNGKQLSDTIDSILISRVDDLDDTIARVKLLNLDMIDVMPVEIPDRDSDDYVSRQVLSEPSVDEFYRLFENDYDAIVDTASMKLLLYLKHTLVYVNENRLIINFDGDIPFPNMENTLTDIEYKTKLKNITMIGCDLTTGKEVERMLLGIDEKPYVESVDFIDCEGAEKVEERLMELGVEVQIS